LLDVLRDGQDALIVPKRNAAALADGVSKVIEEPELGARLAAAARQTGTRYDIQAFVNKMERLYVLLHETSRASKRRSILQADVSFLTS
jgi:glycosyltransferase involved in cell wall biosynthesis